MRNLFCRREDLKSEADVESLFVDRLLLKLRYPDNRVHRKASLGHITISRGSKKEHYRPDYALLDRKKRPVIVVDAKAPDQKPSAFHYQVSGYALGLNQRYPSFNPVKYIAVTNGLLFLLYPWDSSIPRLELKFADFHEDNLSFLELRSLLSYGALDIVEATATVFEFARPNLTDLIGVFDECHQMIWKKEKRPPTEAFYEFAKLMFVKLREDHRIATMIESGQQPGLSDFNFSVEWIDEQVRKGVDDNPIANILFRRVRDELEDKITALEKKRIFLKDEPLSLWLSTITEVVRKLEHFDLHGIDEDLNGRMFETFLNATVRGKALGQFFTPRSVVKYMTKAAQLRVSATALPTVFDGCCGSGGFLIEAMAVLVHGIDAMSSLSAKERSQLKKKLYEDHLFGVDANETIARISRLNMYLHGDGGSKIFAADTLDKTLEIDKGIASERRTEIEELVGYVVNGHLKFDCILTNPPFSMSYSRKDKHELRVLDQYRITLTKDGKPGASGKSNVLFIERYHELLKDGKDLLTIIDNTVLNGIESQAFRNFILDNFIIRQVVSLPVNTFFRAQANVQTSILHLRKKEAGDKQGHVFMAILNNVGHDDYQRYTPERDNTMELAELFLTWTETGKVVEVIKNNHSSEESLGCPFQAFVVSPERLNYARLDAFYYSPDLRKSRDAIRRRADKGHIELMDIAALQIVPTMTQQEVEDAQGRMFRYFEIGDVTKTGAIVNSREASFDDLPSRARLRVRENDVVFARHRNSRGTAVIVPPDFDGQLVTTGFMAIRPKDTEEALLLWSIFTSETFKKQIYYLSITAVQPEVREDIFRKEFILPIPKSPADRKVLVAKAERVRKLQEESRSTLEEISDIARKMFEGGSR